MTSLSPVFGTQNRNYPKENLNLHVFDQGVRLLQLLRRLKIGNSEYYTMMCLLKVYLVCNLATECKKDGCKKGSEYTLSAMAATK